MVDHWADPFAPPLAKHPAWQSETYKPAPETWSQRFAWLPVYVENGTVAEFGWRWLTPVWHRWFEGHYADYWSPCTHKWDA